MIEDIEGIFNRMIESSRAKAKAREKYLEEHPDVRFKPCREHPKILRCVDLQRSTLETIGASVTFDPVYEECPICGDYRRRVAKAARLVQCGVPVILSDATFDSFVCENEEDETNLLKARAFDQKETGFLLMTGAFGLGKSHLAAAMLQSCRVPVFRKQSTLLGDLRKTYSDRTAQDPIELCKDASTFVLDELGVSGGGRDEFPMLHEILDYRHSFMRKTVITTNDSFDAMAQVIGERLVDRLKQSCAGMLYFSGPSKRTAVRNRYHDDKFYEDVRKAAQSKP